MKPEYLKGFVVGAAIFVVAATWFSHVYTTSFPQIILKLSVVDDASTHRGEVVCEKFFARRKVDGRWFQENAECISGGVVVPRGSEIRADLDKEGYLSYWSGPFNISQSVELQVYKIPCAERTRDSFENRTVDICPTQAGRCPNARIPGTQNAKN